MGSLLWRLSWLLALVGTAARPLKTAYLHQGLGDGEVEASLLAVCAHVDRSRIDPHVVVFGRGSSDALAPALAARNCSVARFPARWRDAGGRIAWEDSEVARLVDHVRREEFDAVVAYFGVSEPGESVPLGVAVARRAGGVPAVVRVAWAAAPPAAWSGDVRAFEVPSPFVAREQFKRGVPNVHLVGAGVAAPNAAPPPTRRKRVLRVGRDAPVVLANDPISCSRARSSGSRSRGTGPSS
jgi:hypothetical protein